jgi:hypothetical protein
MLLSPLVADESFLPPSPLSLSATLCESSSLFPIRLVLTMASCSFDQQNNQVGFAKLA